MKRRVKSIQECAYYTPVLVLIHARATVLSCSTSVSTAPRPSFNQLGTENNVSAPKAIEEAQTRTSLLQEQY